MTSKKTQELKKLPGHFFHTFRKQEGGKRLRVVWQGRVVAEVCPGYFLVQLYEWLSGRESDRKIVTIDQMLEWDFYESSEEMGLVYQQNYAA